MGPRLGARIEGTGTTRFLVWAPEVERVGLRIEGPSPRALAMDRRAGGYHETLAEGIGAGTRYRFDLGDGRLRADPASCFQPHGVHGPSEVVDSRFPWTDAGWTGLPLEDLAIYELHVGAFTPEGTFDAIRPRLPDLRDLGITALELMPIGQFPGVRNWGYDGVFPSAAQNSYGGPDGLRRLVDACHAHGLAVILDVVYNHLGPEGNRLADFGPYFTDAYRTPWGLAVNVDGPGCDDVRRFFLESARSWIEDMHVDALRLDAVHAITDTSAYPFLEELADTVHGLASALGRRVYVIPEDDRNDSRLIRTKPEGGFGLDAVWSDDFHHALHAFLTKERSGYYADFGSFEQLPKVLADGVVFEGQVSRYRGRQQGRSFEGVPAPRLVVYAQNHDQVGNRARSERLSSLVPFEALKLAATFVVLSPFTPLLFMGEEYGDPTPFYFFTSHGDPALAQAVWHGRQREFQAFDWSVEIPDPQAEATFVRSRPNWDLRRKEDASALLAYHRDLLRLRRSHEAFRDRGREHRSVGSDPAVGLVVQERRSAGRRLLILYRFAEVPSLVSIPAAPGSWAPVLDSSDRTWKGPRAEALGTLTSDGRLRLGLEAWEAVVLEHRGGS